MSLWQILVIIYVVGGIVSGIFQHIRLKLKGEALFTCWPRWDFWEDVGWISLLCLFWPIFMFIFSINVIIEEPVRHDTKKTMVSFVGIRYSQKRRDYGALIQQQSRRIRERIRKAVRGS